VVRLPLAEQEVLGRREDTRSTAQQAQGGDSSSRPPGHAQTGGNIPEHRGRLPL